MELRTWELQSLQSGVFSAFLFYGEQQKKKNTFFCCQKGHSLRTDAFSPKKGGRQSLSSIFSEESGASVHRYTTLLIHITHWKKKYTRTATAGGLNGQQKKKKRCEEFTGIEEGFN